MEKLNRSQVNKMKIVKFIRDVRASQGDKSVTVLAKENKVHTFLPKFLKEFNLISGYGKNYKWENKERLNDGVIADMLQEKMRNYNRDYYHSRGVINAPKVTTLNGDTNTIREQQIPRSRIKTKNFFIFGIKVGSVVFES